MQRDMSAPGGARCDGSCAASGPALPVVQRGARARASRSALGAPRRRARASTRRAWRRSWRRSPSGATSPRSWCGSTATSARWRGAARGGAGREAHRVPAPGDPARAQHDRREGRRRPDQRLGAGGQGRGGKAARAGAERRVSAVLITISGLPGSGKTTVARLVARELGLEHVYAGNIFRRQAEAHGLTLAEYLRRAETDPRSTASSTADGDAGARAATRSSRAGWPAFMADRAGVAALKVFLDASEDVAGPADQRPGGGCGGASACARSRPARRRITAATLTCTGSITTITRDTISSWRRTAARPRRLRRPSSSGRARASPTTSPMTLGDLLDKVRAYSPAAPLDAIERAYEFSAEVHDGQRRQSGEPYLIHPVEVAGIIAELRLDVPSVATGLLHDTVEDTLATLPQLEALFGDGDRRRWSTASPRSARSTSPRARRSRPRTSARCCSRWRATSASS